MKIEKWKPYHIGSASVTSILPEDDYVISDVGYGKFKVGVHTGWFVTRDYAFTPVTVPKWKELRPYFTPVTIPKWKELSLYGKDLIALYGFSKRSGFTLSETYFFFSDGRLPDYPTISDRTRGLYNDLLKKRFVREGSTDRTDTKLYDVLIDLLEMLLNYSLQEDMYLVPEVQEIVERGVLCD